VHLAKLEFLTLHEFNQLKIHIKYKIPKKLIFFVEKIIKLEVVCNERENKIVDNANIELKIVDNNGKNVTISNLNEIIVFREKCEN
jgi:hypothetical protein